MPKSNPSSITDMSTGSNQRNSKSKTDGGSTQANWWQHARVLASRFNKAVQTPCCWFARAFGNPDNFPGFLIGVFTLLLAIFAYYAWVESRRGTKALEGQLAVMRNDPRPWVSLAGIAVPYDLAWTKEGAKLNLHFTIKNTGRTPALRAWANAKSFIMFGPDPNPQTAQKTFCDDTRTTIHVGDVIFPGDFTIQRWGLDFSRENILTAMRTGPIKTFPILMAFVCINYGFTFDDSTHQTSYIFTINSKPHIDRNGQQSLAILLDEPVAAADIQFERFFLGFDAD